MNEAATDQRKMLASGYVGEFLAMDFFDKHRIPYLHTEQNRHTFSRRLADEKGKRPDFMIWDPNDRSRARLVEIKNHDVMVTDKVINIDQSEVTALRKTQDFFGIPVLLGFAIGEYLFFVRLEDLQKRLLGQQLYVTVEPGPPHHRPELQAKWVVKDALVSWERTDVSDIIFNKGRDPFRLFEDPPVSAPAAVQGGASPPSAAGL